MIITSPKEKTNIRITACNIEQKSQIKYLGVFIDEHLKWDAQLLHINNKIKNIGILFKLRHYVPIKYTRTTVLHSHISVSNVWINELGYRIPK